MEINKIIITNLPAFYKINLFNKISECEKIFVVFTGKTAEVRNEDFFKKDLIKFDYIDLSGRSSSIKYLLLLKLLITANYKELVIGGWDEPLLYIAAFFSPKKKNSVIVESSIYESQTQGLKAEIKKFFLKRQNCAYASGKSQIQLLKALGFNGAIKKTKGVGIFNYVNQPVYEGRKNVKDFLYVGRLSEEKNLSLLMRVFSQLADFNLHIIGFGPLEKHLKSTAPKNVKFYGSIDNNKLHIYYTNFDVLLLPSKSEPWGLVVEEALNNGMPVIASNKVGCVDEVLVDGYNGLVFTLDDNSDDNLRNTILQIADIITYNKFRHNISDMDFSKISDEQVKIYTR
ncbi:glycosyltransferase [Chryseobacterium sp. PBS4-4]|uniref:Glycosyltransferase n=1 Tax=Chryseobacterium edaphi TaxID=2976532 RepID=A0ABT2W910_9FLAO|nr:glycosyltransferase [Chryseobacterium edaphi]MCU7618703.1 glycosyltransferase [Chryseobacterium edaphi]